jgi:hypothetical protein
MTVLREPVERWMSRYFYDRYKESDHGKIALSLDEFLSTDRAKNMGKDYASMILGEQRFQSGRRKESELGAAKSVLSRFDMVETVNRMSELEKRVAEKFGWKINVGKKNKNPTNKKRRSELTDEQYRKIEEICRVNRCLYNFVRGGDANEA